MVSRIAWYGRFLLLMVAVWVIFSEDLSLQTVLMGAIASIVALVLTNRLILKSDYAALYNVRFVPALWYAVRLVVAIYVAGFQALARMLTGKLNVGIVDITTELTDPFSVSLLANSITLTPGTVTLVQTGSSLRVIWLDCTTHDPKIAGPEIKGPFERLLQAAVR